MRPGKPGADRSNDVQHRRTASVHRYSSMIKLTEDWIYIEDDDRKALSLLLHIDFSEVVFMVSRKRLVCWLATAERVSLDSSIQSAAMFDRLVDEADKAGIAGL